MSGSRFLFVKAGRRVGAPDPSPELSAYADARRTALALTDRSCCCPAKPKVMVIMPMASAKGEPVELFLCGHHYRESRRALAEAGAVVYDGKGPPMPVQPGPPVGPAASRP